MEFQMNPKSLVGVMAVGQKSIKAGEQHQLREPSIPYGTYLQGKKSHIGPKNTYFWDVNL